VVICLNQPSFSRLEIVGDKLHCGAGVKLKQVSVEARRAGWPGWNSSKAFRAALAARCA
jgi:hypothetical protein